MRRVKYCDFAGMDKEEYNRLFGQFVQKKRIEQNSWSQSDLASRMGNNFQNISRLERGEINPTLFWFTSLANAFEMKSSELLAEFEEFILTQKGISLTAHYNKLSK